MTFYSWFLISFSIVLLFLSFVIDFCYSDNDKYVEAGGQYVTSPTEFNVAARIFYTDENGISKMKCSAVVYAKNWIMTAAHCFNKPDLEAKDFRNYGIVVGWIDSEIQTPMSIDGVFVPPNFQYNEDGSVEHDFALVKTILPITISNFEQKNYYSDAFISLPADDLDWTSLREKTLNLYSFGLTCNPQPNRDCFPKQAKKVFITLLSDDFCSGDNHYDCSWCSNEESKLCAIVRKMSGVTCEGDSGGPLVFIDKENSDLILIGILITGGDSSCGTTNNNVYINIFFYKDFILKAIRENSNESSSSSTRPTSNVMTMTPFMIFSTVCIVAIVFVLMYGILINCRCPRFIRRLKKRSSTYRDNEQNVPMLHPI